jgi:hypothetical protein
MLQQFLYPQIADFRLNIISQHGTPSYWSLDVPETPTKTFPDSWFGHDGSTPLTPPSPDISAGFIFEGVHQRPSVCAACAPDLPTSRHLIIDPIATVIPSALYRTRQKLGTNLSLCAVPDCPMLTCNKLLYTRFSCTFLH